MVLIVPVLVIGLVIGLGLAVWGWRGRWVDDHPWCVACRFDLFGLPESSTSCPECGADTQARGAVRWGQRERRGKPLVLGGILILSTGLLLGLEASSRLDVQHFVPVAWLWQDIEGGSLQRADAAVDEFKRRIDAGNLSDQQLVDAAIRSLACEDREPRGSQRRIHAIRVASFTIRSLNERMDQNDVEAEVVKPLINELLARAGRSDVRWSQYFGAFVEEAYAKRWVEQEAWLTYIGNCIEPVLEVRRTIAQGDPIVFECGMTSKFGSSRFTAGYELLQASVDNVALDDVANLQVTEEVKLSPPLVLTTRLLPEDRINTPQLTAGTHTLEVSLRIKLYDGPLDNGGVMIAQRDATLSEDFTVLRSGGTSVQLHPIGVQTRSHLRRFLRPYLRPSGNETTPWFIELPQSGFSFGPGVSFPSVFIPKPTQPGGAFDLLIQINEHEPFHVGTVTIPTRSMGFLTFPYDGIPPGPGDTIRFVFKPNPDLARRTVDLHDIWGDEIIFDGTYETDVYHMFPK